MAQKSDTITVRNLPATTWSTRLQDIPIEDRTVKPGNYFFADGWFPGPGHVLNKCTDWDKAEFRYIHDETWDDSPQPAVNIELTARVGYLSLGPDGFWFRCKIHWPGDYSPDQHDRGWVLVHKENRKCSPRPY